MPSCKVPEMSALFEPNVNFPNRFLQKKTIPYFTEIRPVGAVFIHAEGHTQTDRQNGLTQNKRLFFSRQYERD